MMKVLRGLLAGLFLLAMGNAQATLFDRGGGLVYDNVLNVTWLQDANYAKTSNYDTDGRMNWTAANVWAANLSFHDSVRNVDYTDWRLPIIVDTGAPGVDYAYTGSDSGYNVQTADTSTSPVTVYSEMAYMYYVNLENKGFFDPAGNVQSGIGLVDDPLNANDESLFTNLQTYHHWSGLEYAPNGIFAWTFSTIAGGQDRNYKVDEYYAWAVRDGDVVPEPATFALIGIALAGLGVTRRKKAI